MCNAVLSRNIDIALRANITNAKEMFSCNVFDIFVLVEEKTVVSLHIKKCKSSYSIDDTFFPSRRYIREQDLGLSIFYTHLRQISISLFFV